MKCNFFMKFLGIFFHRLDDVLIVVVGVKKFLLPAPCIRTAVRGVD